MVFYCDSGQRFLPILAYELAFWGLGGAFGLMVIPMKLPKPVLTEALSCLQVGNGMAPVYLMIFNFQFGLSKFQLTPTMLFLSWRITSIVTFWPSSSMFLITIRFRYSGKTGLKKHISFWLWSIFICRMDFKRRYTAATDQAWGEQATG